MTHTLPAGASRQSLYATQDTLLNY